MEYNYHMEYIICISYHIGIMELKRDSSKQHLYIISDNVRGDPQMMFPVLLHMGDTKKRQICDDSLALQTP